jgi:hypothetical protein|tara:strand:+ start:1804 stop:2169 length:366 start_codon:yes stop_codon:yes gene_type:complete
MKVKRTFFNSRNERLYWNYEDTNNWLFTIIHSEGKTIKEKNFILRDLLQNESTIKNIYKKIKAKYDIKHIDTNRISYSEYNLLKNLGTPTITDCVKTEQLSGKELQETERCFRQDYELQEV